MLANFPIVLYACNCSGGSRRHVHTAGVELHESADQARTTA